MVVVTVITSLYARVSLAKTTLSTMLLGGMLSANTGLGAGHCKDYVLAELGTIVNVYSMVSPIVDGRNVFTISVSVVSIATLRLWNAGPEVLFSNLSPFGPFP
ncbi:hypothetical protein EDB92DRAFT_1287651 [Lactarius akahatsu]|uniref:Uncharacterized protein n=1 Tax=Lactarius akahatsu TaxID=416441 RepID=A0AAD4LG35_9AGAM|nr:hypothetical protein EDB92DRAFT_1287651 [Lactarius akahatsu]